MKSQSLFNDKNIQSTDELDLEALDNLLDIFSDGKNGYHQSSPTEMIEI